MKHRRADSFASASRCFLHRSGHVECIFAVSYALWVASLWARALCLEANFGSILTVVSNFSTAMRDLWPQTSAHNSLFSESFQFQESSHNLLTCEG